MEPDWSDLIQYFLHDPPGKATGILGHESRSGNLISIALDTLTSGRQVHDRTRTEDILASIMERVVPLPSADPNGVRAVNPVNGRLTIFHPLSGTPRELDISALSPQDEVNLLRDIVHNLDPERARALAIWRLFRDRLAERNATWSNLPADTRLPDHTIWNHMDAAMGFGGSTGQGGIALLMFSLGPVQPFIASARTVRDLWSGSYLLAWLTFKAMEPIINGCGPAAIVSPALRGNPLMDHWLRNLRFAESPNRPQFLGESNRVHRPEDEQLLSPCLPNRFSAIVPWGNDGEKARELAQECETACRQAWLEISEKVRRTLSRLVDEHEVAYRENWDRDWKQQVESFFEIRTVVLPRNECSDEVMGRLLATSGNFNDALPHACRVRELESCIPGSDQPGYRQDQAGQWMGLVDLLGRLMAARRTLRPLPEYRPVPDKDKYPGKCSLLGTYEQMGPAERGQAEEFWNGFVEHVRVEGARVRKGEKLCAVSLVKRFAWAVYLHDQLKLSRDALRYPDTATVAATRWLAGAGINPDEVRNWSGQWLHWSQRNPQDEDEDAVPEPLWKCITEARRNNKPPTYYAILMLDGDKMGDWLRGKYSRKVEEVLHPTIQEYFRRLPDTAAGLAAQRPFGPSMQAALSEALTNFALHFVPKIVEEHQGTLIYAGGDDVLALLPTETALSCAAALNDAYRQNWATDSRGSERMLMGCRATVSAGLAVVHYKEDLRVALNAAREAEKQAKKVHYKDNQSAARDSEKQAKKSERDALCVRVVRRSGEDSSAVVKWDQVLALQHLVGDFRDGVSNRWAYRLREELPTLEGLPVKAFEAELLRQLSRVENGTEEFRTRVRTFWCNFLNHFEDSTALRAGVITLYQSAAFLARGRDQ